MKTKQPYAALPHVESFIEWFAIQLDPKAMFSHRYVNRRTGVEWHCSSLYDAYASYMWNHPGNERLAYNPGSSTASNDNALAALRTDLIAAGTDDNKMLQATIDIMGWGGVTARNVSWLKEHKEGLGRMVNEVAAALAKNDPDVAVLKSKELRFNSGMTKVYSLICKDFVIYDSRVAAALGAMVVRFCHEKGLTTVPAALKFPWAAAKESETSVKPKRRNPSTGTLKFGRLRAGAHHARWNLHANWVLSQAAKHPLSEQSHFRKYKTHAETLRSIEMALFAIGYDLA